MNNDKKQNKTTTTQNSDKNISDARNTTVPQAYPGINTPGIELPAFNPPVPNRAWTAMRNGVDIEELSEEEKRDLYVGNDNIF